MKRNETVFDYLTQIFIIFGFTVLTLNIFCLLFGEDAKAYSTIFSLGSQGLSIATMLQFFLVSVVIATLRFLLFTDSLLKKNMSVAFRTICMFALIILMMVLCIICFDWFPVGEIIPWIMFLLCFGISAVASTIISIIKENMENKMLADALAKLKENNVG